MFVCHTVLSFCLSYCLVCSLQPCGHLPGRGFQGGTSFVNLLCYLCLVFVMLSCLFIAVLWSSTGKGLTYWFLFMMFYCNFVTFPCGNLRQVWYLIVMIPDPCHLSYFDRID